jgi:cytidine deaminase
MREITVAELCARAQSALNPQDLGGFLVADVACAVVAEDGSVYTGTCVGGHLGLCAEQSAVSAMVAHGPPRITRLAAVWQDPEGALHALPPCGRCREFLRLMSQSNLQAEIVLGLDRVVVLQDLLPSHGWLSQLLWPAPVR